MIPSEIAAFLRYPFYKLYYIEQVDSFPGIDGDEVVAIREEYSTEILDGIVNALRWVLAHPAADLTKVLPGLHHSNSDMHAYSAQVLHALQERTRIGADTSDTF